ncbi:hypothetical protein FB384_003028 [Prauserella sediminis]|uniref:Uncharacterized protein n=1 Tax=Prauserella sediminis TaxID=577680 RepID=A0A839XRQ4_9PSEU|nr:hypothetical protein [Prauserella sediminis]MBB3664124.1 hypothetical protein [Prauserella sediminis]
MTPMTTPEGADAQPGVAGWHGPAGFGRTLLVLLPLLVAHVLVDITALSGGLMTIVFWPFVLAGYALISLLVWLIGRRGTRWSAGRAVLTGVMVHLFVALPLSAVALAFLNEALTQ